MKTPVPAFIEHHLDEQWNWQYFLWLERDLLEFLGCNIKTIVKEKMINRECEMVQLL